MHQLFCLRSTSQKFRLVCVMPIEQLHKTLNDESETEDEYADIIDGNTSTNTMKMEGSNGGGNEFNTI